MSINTQTWRPAQRRWTIAEIVGSPQFFWFALGLYLLAHIVLRLWETPNIAKNDVQEAVAAQGWAWGYHPRNPPLHTWMLMSSYAIFGTRLMAHIVLKYLLLGATLSFGYLNARRLISKPQLAVIAGLSMTLLAPFAWTVHTALTHTLLLAAINLATLWAALRLTASRRGIDYAIFGLVIGLGFLAKYSYALFLLPLIAAMLTQAELRQTVIDRRIAVTFAVALLVFAPHGIWMLEVQFDFIHFLASKQHNVEPRPYLADVGLGLGGVAFQALAFLTPLLLVFAATFRKTFGASASRAPSPWETAIIRTILFSLGLLVIDVIVLRAVQFEQRYMMCALLLAPLAAFAWLARREISARALSAFVVATVAVGALVLIALPARALLAQRTCHRCWEEMATPELVHAMRVAGFAEGTIIADHYNLAGNMRLAFPDARIVAANYEVATPPVPGEGRCALVWNARNAGDPLPAAIVAYLDAAGVEPQGTPSYVVAPLRRSRRMDRFGFWILDNTDANCNSRAQPS